MAKYQPQLVTLHDVTEAIEKAIENKTIQFLKPGLENSESCVYKEGKYTCAVGAVLDEDSIKRVEETGNIGSGVASLYEAKIIRTPNKNERKQITALQMIHDDLVSEVGNKTMTRPQAIAHMRGAVAYALKQDEAYG